MTFDTARKLVEEHRAYPTYNIIFKAQPERLKNKKVRAHRGWAFFVDSHGSV